MSMVKYQFALTELQGKIAFRFAFNTNPPIYTIIWQDIVSVMAVPALVSQACDEVEVMMNHYLAGIGVDMRVEL